MSDTEEVVEKMHDDHPGHPRDCLSGVQPSETMGRRPTDSRRQSDDDAVLPAGQPVSRRSTRVVGLAGHSFIRNVRSCDSFTADSPTHTIVAHSGERTLPCVASTFVGALNY